MAMNDPLGDMLTRIRNAQMRKQVQGLDARLEAARARARRAAERRLHPRLSRRSSMKRPHRVRDRAEVLRRPAGDPRDRARLEAGPPRLCVGQDDLPRVANGLGVSILSTPKGVMADHEARDAECRRRSSLHACSDAADEESKPCRASARKPVAVPSGVTAKSKARRSRSRARRASCRSCSPTTSRRRWTDGAITVEPRDETKRARAMWGMSRTLVAQPGDRRHRGLRAEARDQRRRLPRRGAGQESAARARLQPRRRLSRSRKASRSRRRSRPRSSSPASTSSRSARWRRRSAASAPPEPYKGKGVKYAGEFIFRKEGKKK